jgi:hypothetical protein
MVLQPLRLENEDRHPLIASSWAWSPSVNRNRKTVKDCSWKSSYFSLPIKSTNCELPLPRRWSKKRRKHQPERICEQRRSHANEWEVGPSLSSRYGFLMQHDGKLLGEVLNRILWARILPGSSLQPRAVILQISGQVQDPARLDGL